MNSNTLTPTPPNTLLAAASIAVKSGDESAFAVAFELIKRRHRARNDVRAKLIELAERKQGASR